MIINYILYLILMLLTLFDILISTPFSYQISYKYKGSIFFNYNVIISTFFFKFNFKNTQKQKTSYIKVFGFKKELKKSNQDKKNKAMKNFENKFKENKKDKPKENSSKNKFPLKIITKNNILHVMKFIKNLLKYLIPKKIKTNFTIGTDQPDLNGFILAYYYALKEIYPNIPLKININWQERTFKSNGFIKGFIIPIELIFKILLFVFSTTTIKIGWNIYKYKKRKDR
ncbi:MAG: hypothetical protein K9K32_02280 [Halanaerobiales bacterium]|nr:hypothetical protein [Halanaerobiales bacterium]